MTQQQNPYSIECSNTVVDEANQENPQRVQSQTDFPTWTNFIQAVVNSPDYIQNCQDKSSPAYYCRSIQNEVQESFMARIFALGIFVYLMGDISNHENTQVIHLGWNTEGIQKLITLHNNQQSGFHIIMNSFKYKANFSPTQNDRWGVDTRVTQIDLLAKKDQQIKRLQQQLDSERRRADDALKMLDSFRGVKKLEDGNSEGLKSQVSRRLKAEQETRLLRAENEKLRSLLTQHIHSLKLHQSEINDSCN